MKKTTILLTAGLAIAPFALQQTRLAAAEIKAAATNQKENGRTYFVSALPLESPCSPDDDKTPWKKIGGGPLNFSEAYDFFKSQVKNLSQLDTASLKPFAGGDKAGTVWIISFPDGKLVATMEIHMDSLRSAGYDKANASFDRLDTELNITRGQALALKRVLDGRSLLVARLYGPERFEDDYSIGSEAMMAFYLGLSAWCCKAQQFDIALSCFEELLCNQGKPPEKKITLDSIVQAKTYEIYQDVLAQYLQSAYISNYGSEEVAAAVLSSGRVSYEMRDYEYAVALMNEAIEINPKNPELYRLRASAYRGFAKQDGVSTEIVKLCNAAAAEDDKAAELLEKKK